MTAFPAIILALVVVLLPASARGVRAQALAVKEMDYLDDALRDALDPRLKGCRAN